MSMFMAETLQGLPQCPHCGIANPGMVPLLQERRVVELSPIGRAGVLIAWCMYRCTTCQMVVTAGTRALSGINPQTRLPVGYLYPAAEDVSPEIPDRPRGFLVDAAGSLNAPSASIMASCSAIDAMLKEKGIGRVDAQGKQQSLAKRIDIAVAKNILTEGMSVWAHRIRLDANDQRHADEDAPPPTIEQARQILRLSKAIAELLFILPAALPSEDAANGTAQTA